MAKIRLGQLVGAVSGSLGSTVYSHNRFGAYVRLRSTPTQPRTEAQLLQRSIITNCAQAWQGLSAAVKAQWQSWAQANPIMDVLGDSRILSPHQAFIRLSSRSIVLGGAVLSTPPVAAAPTPLLSITPTFDIGAGDFEIAYTATPLSAGEKLVVWACVVDSAGITYVKNRLKQVFFSAAAAASPADPQSAIEARFGTLEVGQYVHYSVLVGRVADGQYSAPLRASGVVVTT